MHGNVWYLNLFTQEIPGSNAGSVQGLRWVQYTLSSQCLPAWSGHDIEASGFKH